MRNIDQRSVRPFQHACLLRMLLLVVTSVVGVATSGCATTQQTAYDDTAPDPAWYQSNDNPFHAD